MNGELFSLQGRTALVTGASSGLGNHFARVLAEAGARVVVGARRVERLESLVNEIQAAGGEAHAVALDVTDAESVTAAFESAEAVFDTVDVLINNAGVADPKWFVDIDESSWDFMMNTNLKGVWRVARECCRRLIEAGKPGSIVNLSSILGLGVQGMQSHYSASKAAVAHMTHAMASELWRYGIRVNALAPGYFKTEINAAFFDSEKGQQYVKRIPPRRLGTLDELSGPLLLLASDASSYMSGVVLPVDGGHLWASL